MVRTVRTCTRRGTNAVHSTVKYTRKMTIWEFGLDEQPFAAIVTGAKTIEGRLNRGKFAQFAVGDVVKVRRDYRDDNGNLQDGQSDAARVEIVGIRQYMDFLAMVAAEGHEKVSPGSDSVRDVARGYEKYYSAEDQATFGVLAIEVRVIN